MDPRQVFPPTKKKKTLNPGGTHLKGWYGYVRWSHLSRCSLDPSYSMIHPGGGALEWQEGVSGSSMDSQKAP